MVESYVISVYHNVTIFFIDLVVWSIYINKSKGPSMDPWGTPDITGR